MKCRPSLLKRRRFDSNRIMHNMLRQQAYKTNGLYMPVARFFYSLLFIIIYFATSGDPEVTQQTNTEMATPSVQSPTNQGQTASNQQNGNITIDGNNVEYVGYSTGLFIHTGENWIEESDKGSKFRFKEVGAENCCVHLRDDGRKMDVLIDLEVKRITFQHDNGGNSGLVGNITEVK